MTRPAKSPFSPRIRLLAGASAVALLAAGAPAWAASNPFARSFDPAAAATQAAANQATQSAAVAALSAQALVSFQRASSAISAQIAAQQAAAQAAVAAGSSVPNGLTVGGLLVAPNASDPNVWQGASQPSQSTSNGQTTVTIDQTQQKAILTWTTFNVGQNTEIYFNQSAGNTSAGNSWVALNRIVDPSGNPAQILGQIKAQGAVYLLDQNGIIFGAGSQVNVNTLIASSLPIFGDQSNNTMIPGSGAYDAAVSASNNTFLTSGISNVSGSTGYLGNINASLATVQSWGDVTVDAGASITAGNLGFVFLAAPNVSNAGSIMANDGQIVLAAGMAIGANPFSSSLPDGQSIFYPVLLGSTPQVNRTDTTPLFSASNTGLLEATTGNVTVEGYSVTQGGVIATTTSITSPGSIVLSAEDEYQGGYGRAGSVTFTPTSVTTILPDEDGETTTSTAAATSAFQPGAISVTGGSVTLQGDGLGGGALIYGPGVTANITALADPFIAQAPSDPTVKGRIYIDGGAVIDVSGLPDVVLPMSANLVTIGPITANDLADDPEQQNGFLVGQTITVDSRVSGTNAETGQTWVGTPLIDASSYVQDMSRTIDQMLVNGGTINLGGGQVITAPGSVINVAGGYIQYLGGMVNTTQFLGANGQIYSAADADPNVPIVGIAGVFTVDHPHWGITQTWSNPLAASSGTYEPGYIQGGDAGTLNIFAGNTSSTGALILNGALQAAAVSGPYQVANGALATEGSLVIGDSNLASTVYPAEAESGSAPITEQAMVIADQGTSLANVFSGIAASQWADTPLSTPTMLAKTPNDLSDVLYTSTLSAPLIDAAGFSSITINANNNELIVQPGATLSVQPGAAGKIALSAALVTVDGSLIAPSGQISVTTNTNTNAVVGPLEPNPANPYVNISGTLTIGPGAVLSAAGEWVNDTGLGFGSETGMGAINGGSISLATDQFGTVPDQTGSIILEQGSLLDVSSGGYVQSNGQLAMSNAVPLGRGGSIALTTYVGGPYGDQAPTAEPTNATIVMDGTLRGYGFSGGGTLTIQASDIVIGSAASAPAGTPAYALYLPASVFTGQGFGAYDLTSIYDATIMAGTVVTPTETNFIPNITALLAAPTGANLYGTGLAGPDGSLVTLGQLDAYNRQATNFSLTAGSYLTWNADPNGYPFEAPVYAGVSGTLLLGQGATINADAGASISLSSYGQLTDLGAINAPGGSIALTGLDSYGANLDRSVWLGADSVLNVSGVVLTNPLAAQVTLDGRLATPVTGTAMPGGSVTVEAAGGYVVAQGGALIEASGASGVFDLPQDGVSAPLQTSGYAPQSVWSNAGQITLGATSGLYFDGTLSAQAGAAQAQGGTLTIAAVIASDTDIISGKTAPPQTAGILLEQSGELVPAGLQPGAPIEPTLSSPSGVEHFAADTLDSSGITNLVLGANPSGATYYNQIAPITLGFAGSVNLSLGQSIIVDAMTLVALPQGRTTIPGLGGAPALGAGQTTIDDPATGQAPVVSMTAPYVEIGGDSSATGAYSPVLALADGVLNVTAVSSNGAAGVLDLTGQFGLQNFGNANFTSSGDIRFYTPVVFDFTKGLTDPALPGELVTAGNLTFKAADVYPATGNTFIIDANAGGLRDANGNLIAATVTIQGNGSSTTPLSAGGALLIDATNIVQDGTLRAPSGSITLGVGDTSTAASAFNDLPLVQTQSVALGAGSLTSVSLDGAIVPYGTTVDGLDWQFQPLNGATSYSDLTAPPAKVVSLSGAAIALDPSATIDLSGGGELQAQEWVPGTGGSRNVLLQTNTTYPNGGATAVQTPLYSDDRQVYAVIPGYSSAAAPYDPEFAQDGSAVGQSVYLSGAPGLPAGVYTLLPAQYATLPGAYRVVQNTGVVNALASQNTVLPDGTDVVEGYFTNSLTGASSAQTTSFQVQSAAVWGKYSQYTLTNADTYFASQATENGVATPRLPVDAGQLSIAATSGLTFGATLDTTPGTGGRGAEVDIASQDIQITGQGEAALPGYLQISADALDALGASSLLIGGARANTATGETITALANSVVVSNDAADPLSGPEILLVTTTNPSGSDPNAANGLLVQSGSVIQAQGSILAGADVPITIGSTTASGDGALLEVSNGAPVTVTRLNAPANPLGLLTVQANTTLSGGQSLILNSSGDTLVDPSAVLSGNAITADAATITFVGANNQTGPGLVIGPATLAQFAVANEVILQSYGAIDFAGNIDVALSKGALDLSAAAFTTSTGGNVTISAPTLILTNVLGGQPGAWSGSTSGALTLNAGELDFGTGEAASSTAPANTAFQGFSQITANGASAVVAQGTGGVFNFGAASVTLNTPLILADSDSGQTLQTTGTLALATAPGAALQRDAIGGAITLIGGSISDTAPISAPGGNVTLEATSGDLTLASGASINAGGVAKQFYDVTEYAPAGAITLIADQGAITVPSGVTLDFAGNAGGGNAGSLTISAPVGAAALEGTIEGGAAAGFTGGSFSLTTGGSADLDSLASELAASGVTNAISVTTGQGNLMLSAGNTLTATTVSLVANGGTGGASDTADGNVIIDGTINANGVAAASGGAEGGTIDLYGKSSVDVEGTLLAEGSDAYANGAINPSSTQLGGTINIGTTGAPTANFYNLDYGYEDVALANSGKITLGSAAILNVSGGGPLTLASDGLEGGTINLRAPLLNDGSVNVSINMANPASQIVGSRATSLEAYAVWSTTDNTTGVQYFDGIIDPAGWYDSTGNLVAGTLTNITTGQTIAYTPGSLTAAQLASDLETDYFTPTTANADHETFYGYVNGDPTQGAGTLMSFIETPGFVTVANTSGIANFNEVPGVELDNPSSNANGGAISVLTDWNLGAGATPTTLVYRYLGQAPFLTFRAVGDINIDASISDGFYQVSPGPNIIQQLEITVPVTNPTTADGDYSSHLNFVGFGETVPAAGGGTYTVTPGQYYISFSAPASGQTQTYYTNYANYYSAIMSTWYGAVNTYIVENSYGHGALTAPPAITPTVAAAAPNPNNYSAYGPYNKSGTYLYAYINWLKSSPLFSATSASATPPPPAPPTNISNYIYYDQGWTQYKNYTLGTLGKNDGGNGVGATLYIYPPAPPPLDPNVPTETLTSVAQTTVGGNNPSPVPTPQDPAALEVATLTGGASSSYRIIAGADFASADPTATEPLASFASGVLEGQGNVTVDGNFNVVDSAGSIPITIALPTMVRTGTGAIDIAAGNDFALLDTVAPGVVYTAGTPAANTTASPSVSTVTPGNGNPFVLLATGPVNPVAGGDISISAGNDIVGIEQVYDTTGAITGAAGTYLGQFWWPWMESGNATVFGQGPTGGGEYVAISSSINFGAFDQGVMSVGGNVSVSAGHDISDLSVSLPTTWYLTEAGSSTPVTTISMVYGVITTPGLTVNTVGGGNLVVSAGGDILSGDYFVAKGTGVITAGGQIGSDFTFAPTGDKYTSPVATLLATQDGVLTVSARQTADIGGVYNPSYMVNPFNTTDSQSDSASSSVSIQSTTGNVDFDTLSLTGSLFNYGGGHLNDPYTTSSDGVVLPATLNLVALNGGIAVDGSGELYPSAQGQLNLIANGSIQLSNSVVGSSMDYFGLIDFPANLLPSPLNPLEGQASSWTENDLGPNTTPSRYQVDDALHDQDSEPVHIYSLTGSLIDGTVDADGFYIDEIGLVPNTPALIYAGDDIVNLSLLGQNYSASDVTRVIAGRDIYDTPLAFAYGSDASQVPVLVLSGPGTFDVEAGRNIGPLTSSDQAYGQNYSRDIFGLIDSGVITVGNEFDASLPAQSASITVLFGVGPGINTAGFANAYIDPSASLPAGISSYDDQLVDFVEQYETDQNQKYGTGGAVTGLTPAQAWTIFETLPSYQQQLLVNEVYFDILNQTGLDYNNASSPYYHQYARGYGAINTLFPASYGYTANNLAGGTNGANAPVSTGYLDMRGSTIQTQQGGNISILGPGGEILVGSASAPPFLVNAQGQVEVGPANQGILTLETGDIDIFSDQSLLLAQSRVFTEQGGDLVIWSSNGNINAGEGVKTTFQLPAPTYTCDPDRYCTLNPVGEVTGAGIATLQTIPGAPPGNADLIAPRGTVDAGAAGIRVSGDLNIAALYVANAFNIQVQGTATGIPTAVAVNVGALTSANGASAAVTQIAAQMAQQPPPPPPSAPTILTIRLLGFGDPQ